MAAAAAAALLDELMGRNRNLAPNEQRIELNWEDPDYCKYYMVQFCPHDLFVNTRADLGACSKIHDDEVKKLFDDANNSYKKIQYMEEFIRFCTTILNEVNRKIDKGKQRLLLMGTNDHVTLTPAQTQRNTEQIALLSDKINKLVDEAQEAGVDGDIEKAQGIMKLCDQLKEERDNLRKVVENSQMNQTAALAAEQEKQMEVCEVCGAFLIVGDAQQRIDDHLMGKQHVGYARLKKAIEEITEAKDKLREERDKQRDSDRKDRHSGRDSDSRSSRDHRNDRGNRNDRDRSDRDRNRMDRNRDRDRDKDRDRDRRSDRHRRHDDRKDKRRDRSRDRDGKHRSHGKDDSSRHRSRDHHSDAKRSKHDGDNITGAN